MKVLENKRKIFLKVFTGNSFLSLFLHFIRLKDLKSNNNVHWIWLKILKMNIWWDDQASLNSVL